MEITGNGQSGYLQLRGERTKVFVKYGSGAAGTLTPQAGLRSGHLIAIPLPNGDATITADTAFVVEGGGQLSFSASGVSGTITVETD